jgi:hypothetical protein
LHILRRHPDALLAAVHAESVRGIVFCLRNLGLLGVPQTASLKVVGSNKVAASPCLEATLRIPVKSARPDFCGKSVLRIDCAEEVRAPDQSRLAIMAGQSFERIGRLVQDSIA